MSLDILSIFSDRDNHKRYRQFINPDTISPETYTLLNDMGEYFSKHPSESEIEWESFKDWFCLVKHPTWKLEKLSIYETIFDKVDGYTPSSVATDIVEKYIEMDYCQQIANEALKGAEGSPVDMTDIESLLKKCSTELGRATKLEEFLVSDDITELLDAVVLTGYTWRLPFLNQAIGNIRNGKLMCFAARPNMGKTTFLASEATHVAEQLEDDECVLWFNNEEDGKDVKLRIIQAALQCTVEDINSDPTKAMDKYKKTIGNAGKIKVVDIADINTHDVEEFCKNYKVKFIIFDQLWKVHGFEKTSGTDTARLGNIFQWARELAKKYAPVLTVHQLKTEAEGEKYPTLSQLYLSGTVIQGEVDSLIMMGRSYEAGQEYNRFISIVKNKGAYGPTVDPALMDGKSAIVIKPDTAEFL